MTTMKKGDENVRRREAYEHILASVRSVYEILIECCHEIDDIELDAARNKRDINGILQWVHDVSDAIYKEAPEIAPPPAERPPRRWPADPSKASEWKKYTRDQALYRVKHHLELVRLVLRECGPFAAELKIVSEDLPKHLSALEPIHRAVVAEIWKDKTDEGKRSWIRDWGLPDGLPEPLPPDRHEALGRLNQKLDTAAKLLDDCAGLAVDLELEGDVHPVRAIGTCLATIFDIQLRIYDERPDLIPQFLKEALELRDNEKRRTTE
jgi:hypothetical protein